ncbi:asparagine synthetase [glutamine-hydrolyzing] [Daktulosphaira vitifoliae]|uniref:asparagine synthetase [glutamine-hydrolyzing] n=1 Tax=Daktulosphaira vitifoliae TaxID=58002 RepID=UPI0021AAEE5E|nr:asparagine synthetase [glutamine-hydrolyzing] [Daktulosphaira vitifoliae]XP_050520194.1 asparagine synthetase [glutamine-hydrolyzing] [Daktulosphaira vitifoliae]
MCGIWALFGIDVQSLSKYDKTFAKISHRGPDAWRLEYDLKVKNVCLGFHRLAIIDSLYGMQPMKLHQYPFVSMVCNGEIFNWRQLGEQHGFQYETKCDVEGVLQLYGAFGIDETVKQLDAEYAFCLVDSQKRKVFVARDPYGVRPLFYLKSDTGIFGISSEAKGLTGLIKELNLSNWEMKPFPPGHLAEFDILSDGKIKMVSLNRFFNIEKPLLSPAVLEEGLSEEVVHANIRYLLTESVKKRMMSNRRIGCLLSGGLDSSLIAAILVKLSKELGLPYPIQTFSIGMEDSPDILAARQVAKHIGSEHHEVIFTANDVLNVLNDVIHTLETADITTIRASCGMYLVSQYIKQHTDTTVLCSGEGADEVAQGYIYFRDAPSPDQAHAESIRLLGDIYMYDGLRADRTTAAHGLELRVPFLDIRFTNYYLNLPKTMRQPYNQIEKYLLRSAFDGTDLLPSEVLWRHKEAFSDGVTTAKKSLFNIIQDWIDPKYTDEDLLKVAEKYPHCSPKSKESLYYRDVFESHYAGLASNFMPYFWMPKWIKVNDPSARFIKHYAAK